MIISTENGEEQSLEQIRALVEASQEARFHSQDREDLYEWVNRTLRQQDYGRLKRGGKGLVRRYIAKMTGLSRAQAARLIRCYQGGGEVKPRAYRRHRLANRYTRADLELLAAVDEAHETLSGPAIPFPCRQRPHSIGFSRNKVDAQVIVNDAFEKNCESFQETILRKNRGKAHHF